MSSRTQRLRFPGRTLLLRGLVSTILTDASIPARYLLANSSWFGPGGSCLQWVGCDKHSHSQDPIWGQLGEAAACLMTGALAVDVRQSVRMVVRTVRLISGDEHPTGCTWVPQACSWVPWRQCRGCRQAPRMFLGTSQPWIHFARGHQSSIVSGPPRSTVACEFRAAPAPLHRSVCRRR